MTTIQAQICMLNLYTKKLGGFTTYNRFTTDEEYRASLIDMVNKYDIITLLSIGDQRIIDEIIKLCSNKKVVSKGFEDGEIIASFYNQELTLEELKIDVVVNEFIHGKVGIRTPNVLSLRMMHTNNVHYVHSYAQCAQKDAVFKINDDYVYMTFD